MPYNETIDSRIRPLVEQWPNTEAKKMFGGICYLINGNIACGVYKDSLILRMGEIAADDALEKTHVRPFDITGRPMRGWIMVAPEGFADGASLSRWIDQARRFVLTLPAK